MVKTVTVFCLGPFSVLLSLSVLSHVFGAVDKTSSSFSAHSKMGNFIIIIIIIMKLIQVYTCTYRIAVAP